MLQIFQYFLISIQAKTLIEYKLSFNFGNTFHDYSNNDRIGVNGNSPEADWQDTTATTMGAFFHSESSLITIPAEETCSEAVVEEDLLNIHLWLNLWNFLSGQKSKFILRGGSQDLGTTFSFLINEKSLISFWFSRNNNYEKFETKGKIRLKEWIFINFQLKKDFFQVSENQVVLESMTFEDSFELNRNFFFYIGGLPFQSFSIQGLLWKVTINNDPFLLPSEVEPFLQDYYFKLPEFNENSLIFNQTFEAVSRGASESLTFICNENSDVRCLTCLCQNSNCEVIPETNSSICKCPSGVTSNETFCLCPKGKYFSGTTCKKCELIFCDFCLNDTWCLVCSDGYVLNEGQCECPDGFYLSEKKCKACSSNCQVCFNTSVCTTCRSGYYLSEDFCNPCGKLCKICESDKCLNCSDSNAEPVLKTKTCSCLPGFRYEKKCKKNYFTISSIKNINNKITVFFSEKTSKTLELSDFHLKYENVKDPRVKFEAISREKYEFKINSFFGIEEGDILTVKIKKNNLKSEKFSTFKETPVQVELEYERKVPDNIWKVVKITKDTLLAMLIVAASFGLVIGPSVFWTLFNTCDLMSFLPLGSIPYPKVLSHFFKQLDPISYFPSPFSLISIPRITEPAYLEARNYGISNSIFFYNLEVILTFLGVNLVTVLLVFAFSALCKGWVQSLFSKILHFYRFGHFLRFLTCSSLKITIFALVQLRTVFVGLSPFIILCMSQKFFNKISDPSQESFYSKWGNLFEDFRNDRGFLSSQFFTLFLIRRIVFAFVQVYLNSVPLLQAGILMFWTCLVIVFCCKYRIFKDLALAVSVFLNEGVVLVVIVLSMMLFADMRIEQVETLEMVIVVVVYFNIITTGFICMCSLVYKCFCKERTRKVERVSGITKVVPSKAEANKSALNTSTL